MTIPDDLLDSLIKAHKNPEGLLGKTGRLTAEKMVWLKTPNQVLFGKNRPVAHPTLKLIENEKHFTEWTKPLFC